MSRSAAKPPSLPPDGQVCALFAVDIAGFTFPSHIHSEAETRIVGSAVVDIYNQDYQPVSLGGASIQVPAL